MVDYSTQPTKEVGDWVQDNPAGIPFLRFCFERARQWAQTAIPVPDGDGQVGHEVVIYSHPIGMPGSSLEMVVEKNQLGNRIIAIRPFP